ncbi:MULTISPECIES: hypothetical protein [unclassified Streptomyces]|uniref:hypothetical protein n=1 Tax=unclassified Streptomyces TaxID=2593676 RepID=UPI0001C18BA6|nr:MULTISPECIES: hypothetical protein [unclassified Streptomyces]AEN13645.1 conserved hypothetical protein [Streptomyces sp. SirexAA-E]MYR70639.1 hypothetical protein [Streptomyces sp. SID4939]MYR99172.1 hypothetical protein [Streptomyces sp. SID4940]MYT67537.1 hypothetical protein [Streptomyces sp. SID8357]MYT86381.1 hypothetical protein [Streptomyces sp. SID8360]
MSNKARFLTAVGAAAAVVALAAPSATAGPTAAWNVTPTGNFTGTAGVTTLTDNIGNAIQCATASANGNAPASPTAGPLLANITAASFNSPCTGPFGSTWTVSAVTPWTINGNTPGGYAAGAGTNGTGKTTGWIGGIQATVTGTSVLGPCTFKVTGTVDAVYNNPSTGGANGTLAVAPAATSPRLLTIGSKTGAGCSIVGATATFKGTYTVKHTSGVSPVITYS